MALEKPTREEKVKVLQLSQNPLDWLMAAIAIRAVEDDVDDDVLDAMLGLIKDSVSDLRKMKIKKARSVS